MVYESRAPNRGIGYVVPGTTRSVHIKFTAVHVNPKDPKSRVIGVLDTANKHLLSRFGIDVKGAPVMTPAGLTDIIEGKLDKNSNTRVGGAPDFGRWEHQPGIWCQDQRLTGEPKQEAGSMREKLMQADPAGLKATLAKAGVEVPVNADQAELVTIWLKAMVDGKI